MRTYLILKDKARRFREDKDIQALLSEIRQSYGESAVGAYSRATADALKARTFDRGALGTRGLKYERLDQLLVDLLMGAR